jgi:pentatricopeptide repeat protein
MSERVLTRMIEASKENPNVRPNFVTYSTVMNAWARAGMPDRAARVLRAMYDDYKTGNNPSAKPDLQSFNTVLKAYTKSKFDDVPQKAESFFKSMQALASQGELDIRPDNFSYAAGEFASRS